MYRNLPSTITSWPFVLSLSALLFNDGWLKAAYPGVLSGKLSDVSGIAVVALLLWTLLPRSPGWVYGGLTAAFAWWKSPLSQPFIDAINALAPVTIGRTTDYTDLLALLVMPLCRRVTVRPHAYAIPGQHARRILLAPVVGATIFGLMATSVIQTRHEYELRKTGPEAKLSRQLVADAVAATAKGHGLICEACIDPQTSATYSGNGIVMSYSFPAINSILFKINAMPTGLFFGPSGDAKANRLRSDLKQTLATQFTGLEYVEKLDPK